MPTYTDTLRERTRQPEQPHYLIAPGEPPEITNDPELLEAREKLIRQMIGIPWAECTFCQQVGFVLFSGISWLFCAFTAAWISGFALLCFSAVTGIPPEGDYDGAHGTCPMCEFVIQGAFWIGVIAATVLLAWSLRNRERNIRRLRRLPNAQLIREYERWLEAKRQARAEEQRRYELEHQAERIAYWNDYCRRRD